MIVEGGQQVRPSVVKLLRGLTVENLLSQKPIITMVFNRRVIIIPLWLVVGIVEGSGNPVSVGRGRFAVRHLG